MPGRLLPCGELALLVELDDLGQVVALAAAARSLPGISDVVPAARTVLLGVEHAAALPGLRRTVEALLPGLDHPPATQGTGAPDPIEIAVTYDGPDLDRVAELTGLTVPEVVAAHTGTDWVAAFGGFAPGFCYLTGGDPRLTVPRLARPRTSVPPGSVGLAGPFSGIYPRSSPGGWQLIGRTDAVLWDSQRTPPALITPGATVRFVVAGEPAR
jgi:KipI family sensor histidine kinase inhibitor